MSLNMNQPFGWVSLNVFTEFAKFNDSIFVKNVILLVTSCARDQDVTTQPARFK